MIEKIKKNLVHLPEILLAITTIWLRFANLGYSDYQGDEIKALFLPTPGQSISDFLLTQRKGPLQFFVTFLLKILNPAYANQLLMRIPFALAGVFAIYFFYKFVRMHFGRRVAFFASFFLTTNGFLVAFSRIVQYQSFVILFMILALYCFSLAVKNPSWRIKGIYLGFISWAVSILAHYDGIFIAPFAFYLLYRWIHLYGKGLLKHLIASLFISGLMLASFYIPFVFAVSDATKSYWQNRVSGGSGKVSSSVYLFKVYHPIYVVHFYVFLGILGSLYGLFSIVWRFLLGKFVDKLNIKGLAGWAIRLVKSLVILEPLRTIVALFAWVLVPLIFLEVFVNVPGTHIYTYLVPLTVIMGLGVLLTMRGMNILFSNLTGYIVSITCLVVLFGFLFLQTHAVFVEHQYEYPWENERFLVWEFHKPSPVFHLSMFGFPYYRHWEEIGEFVRSSENNGFYSTNERKSIARYHIPFEKDSNSAGHFIHIVNPQSFTNEIIYEKPAYWVTKYEPALTFFKRGREIVKVYYMPEGSLEEIQLQGY